MPRNLPKILLAIAAITLLTFSAFFLKPKTSSFKLTTKDDQFLLTFALTKKDQLEMAQLITKLGLPEDSTPEFTFKLDATSSARLAFSLPTEGNLDVNPKEISFTGKHTSPQISPQIFDPINLPGDTNLVIYSPQTPFLFKNNSKLPRELTDWFFPKIDESYPVVLTAFSENAQWVLVFNWKEVPNYEELSNLIKSEPDESYKKEDSEEGTFHLLKFKAHEEEKIFTFFDDGEKSYFASSKEAAQKMLESQKTKDNLFPQNAQDAVFELFYKAPINVPVSEEMVALILDNDNAKSKLQAIDQVRFLLKPQSFSGLIKLK
ncbi:hypothetical protein HY382_00190 [Candidatus Curtissbacteria bacterium]|nr:hypothetical protein [Candidatus Curtissbacteria bacterium]